MQQSGVAHSQPSVFGAAAVVQLESPLCTCTSTSSRCSWRTDAFVRLHTSPQALQLLVVIERVHALPAAQVVSVQVHAPFTQLGVGCAQVVTFCQAPLVLQVCVVLPLQFVWPGRARRCTRR